MKKNFLRVLSVVLCFAMLATCLVFPVSAEEATIPGATPTRISVAVNGDPSTQKGITWYTNERTASVVEIVDELGAPVNAQI